MTSEVLIEFEVGDDLIISRQDLIVDKALCARILN